MMPRVQLTIYLNPASAEVTVNLRRNDDTYERTTAIVDTGAVISLFPMSMLNQLEHRVITPDIIIEQAGIAEQYFEATEALVWLFLEDSQGARTKDLEVRAWFSATKTILLGFDGILD